jgi:hypothetical protein
VNTNQERHSNLPMDRDPALLYVLSCLIAILMAAASLAGILYSSEIYPSDELVRTFVPNDVVSILIGVPILLGSMWLARRGRLIGLIVFLLLQPLLTNTPFASVDAVVVAIMGMVCFCSVHPLCPWRGGQASEIAAIVLAAVNALMTQWVGG